MNLTKAAPTVSLDKHGVTSGLIKVNLNWTSPQAAARRTAGEARGLFGRIRASLRSATARTVDLDLGCMIWCADGTKTVVQALGNAFGSVDRFPYVALDADDRTGSRAVGENLVIGREVRWFTPQDGPGVQDVISRAYRLGMKWTPGRK
ncbi:hypothetical protein ACFY40_01815 [Streptomyces sp. NPDC012950]|uniref:hypothetical protein n=1 Tax=Streptomyces sp. NPDC012950 TaxID=3364858 RepID=UPI0036910D6E